MRRAPTRDAPTGEGGEWGRPWIPVSGHGNDELKGRGSRRGGGHGWVGVVWAGEFRGERRRGRRGRLRTWMRVGRSSL